MNSSQAQAARVRQGSFDCVVGRFAHDTFAQDDSLGQIPEKNMTGKEAGHIDHTSATATPPHVNAVNPDALEVAPGTAHEQLEGWIPELASEEELRVALEKAFDYRGDVTITRKDGSKIEGYLFDRRSGATLQESLVRLYPKNSNEKVAVSYADIAALAFSGRDTAAGKSWEAWMKKYAEKKARGEKDLSLHPEALE
ncbi:MAG TPA: hypothetical protein VFE61_21280 [Candidatus Sulfotelmatobacter sp.]|nr:hypothetical protein [Candidatus Sulfotelmatobacter sp.]